MVTSVRPYDVPRLLNYQWLCRLLLLALRHVIVIDQELEVGNVDKETKLGIFSLRIKLGRFFFLNLYWHISHFHWDMFRRLGLFSN